MGRLISYTSYILTTTANNVVLSIGFQHKNILFGASHFAPCFDVGQQLATCCGLPIYQVSSVKLESINKLIGHKTMHFSNTSFQDMLVLSHRVTIHKTRGVQQQSQNQLTHSLIAKNFFYCLAILKRDPGDPKLKKSPPPPLAYTVLYSNTILARLACQESTHTRSLLHWIMCG